MALNIKDAETERLVAEVAALTTETKTRAVRVALQERRDRLVGSDGRSRRAERLRRFLAEEAWPQVPPHDAAVGKDERAAILGYGPAGV